MKILHVIDSGGFYGAEAMLVELALEQIKAGHSVTICSIGTPSEPEKPIEKVCKERGIKVYPLRMKAGLNLLGGMNIVNYAKQHRFDLFHSHGYKGNILLGILPKFIRAIPLVTTLHGWTSIKKLSKLKLYELFDSLLLSKIDGVALVSEAMLFRKGIYNRNLKYQVVIQNGIGKQASEGSPKDDLTDLITSLKTSGTVIGSVGRLSYEKGYDVLLSSFYYVKKSVEDVSLLILGDGNQADNLKKLASDLEIEKSVYFAGYIESASKYIGLFDIYVNSSRTEGLPITLLETMRAGIPVLASNVGDCKKLLETCNTKLYFESENSQELTQLICSLLNDKDQRQEVGRDLKKIFLSGYTSKHMCDSYTSFYKQVLSR